MNRVRLHKKMLQTSKRKMLNLYKDNKKSVIKTLKTITSIHDLINNHDYYLYEIINGIFIFMTPAAYPTKNQTR